MKYPIAIEVGDDKTAFGVVVPDLPGCFSAGDNIEEAIDNTKEAISLYLESELDASRGIPAPSKLENLVEKPDFKGWVFALVDVDVSALSDKVERVNITLPSRALRRLDVLAKHRGETRSGFLTNLIYQAN